MKSFMLGALAVVTGELLWARYIKKERPAKPRTKAEMVAERSAAILSLRVKIIERLNFTNDMGVPNTKIKDRHNMFMDFVDALEE